MIEDNTQRIRNVLRIAGEVVSQILNVPIVAGVTILYFYFRLPSGIQNRLGGLILAMLFLSLIPAASLLFYLPGKSQSWSHVQRRQRIASFIFMLVSYPIGFVSLWQTHSPKIFQAMALIYNLVTLGLAIFNFLLRYKASGHTAGVAGPIGAMIYLHGLAATPLLALLPVVSWARLAAKGHDLWQALAGAALSLSISVAVLSLYGFPLFQGIIF